MQHADLKPWRWLQNTSEQRNSSTALLRHRGSITGTAVDTRSWRNASRVALRLAPACATPVRLAFACACRLGQLTGRLISKNLRHLDPGRVIEIQSNCGAIAAVNDKPPSRDSGAVGVGFAKMQRRMPTVIIFISK